MDLVTLGELLIDMIPAQVGKSLGEVPAFYPKPGGAPANVAIAARRLGVQSAFVGKVGDDPFGYHLRDVLRKEGVDTRSLRFDAETRTTMAIVAMPDVNTPEFMFYRNPGADTRLMPEEVDLDLLENTRAFHFGSLSLTHEPVRSAANIAAQTAERAGALISFDMNFRADLWSSPDEASTRVRTMLPFIHVLKVNEHELEMLSGSKDPALGSRILLDHGPALVLVTLGALGSFFRCEAGGGHVDGFRVDAVDTVGCGDAFVAGVLARLILSGDWRTHVTPDFLHEAIRYGNAAGALTAMAQGVIPALPHARDVEKFLINQIA
jgi:fructokinase